MSRGESREDISGISREPSLRGEVRQSALNIVDGLIQKYGRPEDIPLAERNKLTGDELIALVTRELRELRNDGRN